MINVGFIGAGEIAGTHAAALAEVPEARLVVVFDAAFAESRETGSKTCSQSRCGPG